MGDTRGTTFLGAATKVMAFIGLVVVVLGALGGWVHWFNYGKPMADVTQQSAEAALDRLDQPILDPDLTVDNLKRIGDQRVGLSEYEYSVDVEIKLKNDSEVEIRASVVVFDFYIGTLPDDVLSNGQSIIPLGAPPVRQQSKSGRWRIRRNDYGAIKWKQIGSWGGDDYGLAHTCRELLDLDDVDLTPKNFGVSDLLPGHRHNFKDRFRFMAPPGSFLAVVVCGVTNDCDRFWYTWHRLPLARTDD